MNGYFFSGIAAAALLAAPFLAIPALTPPPASPSGAFRDVCAAMIRNSLAPFVGCSHESLAVFRAVNQLQHRDQLASGSAEQQWD